MSVAALVVGAFLAAVFAAPAVAQEPPTSPVPPAQPPAAAPDECFGLTFGRWEPELDARAAGHRAVAADSAPQRAPHGRDWAARLESGRDTTIILFPAWWPAGVAIRFPEGRAHPGDTTRGTATALVANGDVRPPTTAVLLQPVPCAPGAAPPPARPDRDGGMVGTPRHPRHRR